MSETSFRRLVRHPTATAASTESSALLISATAFVLVGLIAFIAFRDTHAPISGPGSVGQFVALASFVVGVAVFFVARALGAGRSTGGTAERVAADAAPQPIPLRWFDVAALAFAHGMIALLGWIAVADLLDRSFAGADVYPFTSGVLAGVGAAVTAYAVYLSAVRLGPMQLSLVLVVFLVTGVFASMLTATDPLWWQKNLSTLGISDDISAKAFNITLIIAGVIVTTIAHFAASQLPAGADRAVRGRREVRISLSLIGILLAGVGFFPVDEFLTVHNISATGMVIVYATLVLRLRGLVPSAPQPLLLLGYVFLGVIAVLAVFFLTGYYNLTAVELVAFLLVFGWLIVFLRITGAMSASTRQNPLP